MSHDCSVFEKGVRLFFFKNITHISKCSFECSLLCFHLCRYFCVFLCLECEVSWSFPRVPQAIYNKPLKLIYHLEGDSPRIFLEGFAALFVLLTAVSAALGVVQWNHSVIWNQSFSLFSRPNTKSCLVFGFYLRLKLCSCSAELHSQKLSLFSHQFS